MGRHSGDDGIENLKLKLNADGIAFRIAAIYEIFKKRGSYFVL